MTITPRDKSIHADRPLRMPTIDSEVSLEPRAQTIPVERYRIRALTSHNLEKLCHTAYRHVEWEATKYEGMRLTEKIAAEMTSDVVEALETLRLALITAGHDALRDMDLAGVASYYKKNVR